MDWKKLETLEECKSLKHGDELVKYPINGEELNNLNLGDTANLIYGKVEKAAGEETIVIRLMAGKDVDTADNGLLEGDEPVTIDRILKEKRWWFRKSEQ